MGYPIAQELNSGWRCPSRIASLDDYMRKPRRKSKLSKELQEYERVDVSDKQRSFWKSLRGLTSSPDSSKSSSANGVKSVHQETTPGPTKRGATPDTCDGRTRLLKAQESDENTLLQAYTTPSRSSKPELLANSPSKLPLEQTGNPNSINLSSQPDDLGSLASLQPQLFYRYLADLQKSLGSVADQESQALLIQQQAARDQSRLFRGLDPQSYQAKGRVIAIYDSGDGSRWTTTKKMMAMGVLAIEVMHAPLGFPNQEVWLWEGRMVFGNGGVTEGSVVLFRIVWEMVGNHWEVVDVRG